MSINFNCFIITILMVFKMPIFGYAETILFLYYVASFSLSTVVVTYAKIPLWWRRPWTFVRSVFLSARLFGQTPVPAEEKTTHVCSCGYYWFVLILQAGKCYEPRLYFCNIAKQLLSQIPSRTLLKISFSCDSQTAYYYSFVVVKLFVG